MNALGKPVGKYGFVADNGAGTAEVFEEGVVLQLPRKVVSVKKSYVTSFISNGELPMNKVSCVLTYFDMFGGSEKVGFTMRENDFRSLKKSLGK